MPLFQTSVLNKYLSEQDKELVAKQYTLFKDYFLNTTIQENIIASKEEEFQEGFLRELFVKVLGYTINPEPNFNLITELKNEKDSKKADGAIIDGEKVLAVIELKSTKTTDFNKIEIQAFSYKNNQANCKYVITSNFQKIRFYIDNAIEFLEWDLFKLDIENFKLLFLCLHKDSIFKNIPATIKLESITVEENVTKQLYKEYSQFRKSLFNNIVEQNPTIDKLVVFKKTQKLLDRFLFLFFAEDRMLVPPNSVRSILEQWTSLKDMDAYQPLYNRFKLYFGYLNTGHKGKLHDIFAYNGGLFATDEILDSFKMDDSILYDATLSLSNYDYNSEVDVNILGHIFEHSLTEIEELEKEITTTEISEPKTSKRKKDGVFYTPKYITKYIVENTVGTLCKNKKEELKLQEEDYHKLTKKTKKLLYDTLLQYREWLLHITIIDPACGSGAFLNQALEFLIAEHKWVSELEANIFGSPMVFDVESSILENNIFGVDINEESVEIAKLSLWLRTARKGRKLNSLNNNIKCGNSLIDDVSVAGDKAFNWQEQFPQIFEKGGFDVVIGNPPYLRVQGLRENFEIESKFYETKYISASGRFDIYVLFIEKSTKLINTKGLISFILPHKFLISDFGEGIRKFLSDNRSVSSILHFGSEMVFNDASTYTCILNLSKSNSFVLYSQIKPIQILDKLDFNEITYTNLDESKWNLNKKDDIALLSKLNRQPYKIKTIFKNISQGIVSVGDDIFLLKGSIIGSKFIGYSEKLNKEIELESDIVKPILKGEDVKKNSPLNNSYFCLYPHYEINAKTIPFEEEYFKEKYPLAYNYILPYKDELIEKKIRYNTNPKAWYSLHRSREISLFEQIKIVTPETSLGGNLTLDNSNYYHNTQVYSLVLNSEFKFDYKYILAILNSKLFWFFLKSTGAVLRGGYFRFKTKYLEPFPIPNVPDNQIDFIEMVDKNLSKNILLQQTNSQFQKLLSSKFETININTKLEKWYTLSFADFCKELTKQKIKLSLGEQSEWLTYFEQEKQKALAIKNEIDRTDKEIDQIVYQLYGLTAEEIKIVEGE